jgi:uncharacterized membrane protein YesL
MNKLMEFCEYIIWLFVGNLLFLVANLPFVLFYLFVGLDRAAEYRLLFLISLIPLGPAFTALLSAMNRLVRYKDVSIFRDFTKAYKANFKISTAAASIQLTLVFVLLTNIEVIGKLEAGFLFTPFFKLLTCILLLMTFYIYPVIARYHVTVTGVLKTALVLTISKPMTTVGNLVLLLFTFVLVQLKASYAILFVASILCYLIMFFQKHLFASIEKAILPVKASHIEAD